MPAASARPGCGRPLDAGDDLLEDWRRLEAKASLPTQLPAFTAALACTWLDGAEIKVFRASRGDGMSSLLPLCRAEGYFSRWRMVGAREVFEPGDALYTSPAAVAALAESLAGQPRPVTLDRIPARSPLVEALKVAIAGRGGIRVRPAVGCPTITLDERWREPEGCFNSGRRSDFRRAARRAAEFGEVSFEVLSPTPGQFDAIFDEAMAVEMLGWKKEAGSALALDAQKQAFFRTYLRACCERGEFRAAFMRISGKAVAMQLAVECCERFWLFKIGFDEAYARCSPGTLLMLHTLRHAAECDLKAYELLGNIEPWIAEFWTREQHECVQVRTYPYNLRGALAFAADAASWLLGRVARRAR